MNRTLTLWLSCAFGLALALGAADAVAQHGPEYWWAGVHEIDPDTLLTLGADWGQEVRSGRGDTIRHGGCVPLVVDAGGDRVEMTIDAGPDYASRWTLTRSGSEIVIERWVRRGDHHSAWELVRSVRVSRAG